MDRDELNKFILNYINRDKTQRAIMLTASWGAGKSYYIQNSLIPYIEANTGRKCIVVSLYGVRELREVSKSIYFTAYFNNVKNRHKKFMSFVDKIKNCFSNVKLKFSKHKKEDKDKEKDRKEGAAAGSFAVSAILQGVTSYFGVDLSADDNRLEKFYRSIDLSKSFIILEDIERSSLNIIEILGYVNNLVEQDGNKVLLVSFEKELLKTEKINNEKEEVYTEATKHYLREKEKTISDTIVFYSPISSALSTVLKKYNNKFVEEIGPENVVKNILEVVGNNKIKETQNLRSYIYAIQKTIDLFDGLESELSKEFFLDVLLGNIIFVLKKKNDDSIHWKGEGPISRELGSYEYPLYKFSYEFICYQELEQSVILDEYRQYCASKEKSDNESAIKQDLDTIFYFMGNADKDVKDAINRVLADLTGPKTIPINEYARLANYLIAIKSIVGCNKLVDDCKAAILNNLDEQSEEVVEQMRLQSGISLPTEEATAEFIEFEKELNKKITISENKGFNFDYLPEHVESFVDKVYSEENKYMKKRGFARFFDINKFCIMLEECNSYQIEQIRSAFNHIYNSFSNICDIYFDDKEALVLIKEGVINIKKEGYDNIKQKQLEYFVDSLDQYIDRLDNPKRGYAY